MKRYWLRLYPEQPVQLADPSLIPAAALRGALANVLLAGCVPGHEHDLGPCSATCQYWSFFGEGVKLRIGPAYAALGDNTHPFPATARTCSKVPGFKAASGHGIFDIAIRQWAFEQAARDPRRIAAPLQLICPVCAAPLMPYAGLYTRQGERELAVVNVGTAPVVLSGAAMSRTRQQPINAHHTEGIALTRGLYYVARLDAPDPLDDLLRKTVAGGLRIGGSRSRGMGAMRVELVPYHGDSDTPVDRAARFNRAVRTEQRFYTAMDSTPSTQEDGVWYFALDLLDPVAASYESSPSMVPPLKMLLGVEIVRQWLTPHHSGGWHAAADLPRRTQIGAVGVVIYRVSADSKRNLVEEMLTFLETEGLGTGRERGLGSVTICDTFHLTLEPV